MDNCTSNAWIDWPCNQKSPLAQFFQGTPYMVRPRTEDLHVWWLGPMGIGQCCIAGGSNHGRESSQEKSMKKRENNIYKTSTSSIKTCISTSHRHQHNSLLFFFLLPLFLSHDTIHYRTLAKPAKLKFCFNLDCHSCGIQEHRNADSQSQHDRFADLKSRRARLVVPNAVAPFWKRGHDWKKGYDWSNQQNLLRGRTFGTEG